MDDLYQNSNPNSNLVNTTSATNKAASQNIYSSPIPNLNGIFFNAALIVIGFLVLGLFVKLGLDWYRKNYYNNKKLTDWKETVFLEIAVPQETA